MSKTIEKRITRHEIEIRKLNDKKDILEPQINEINKKLIFHWAAISNLENKKSDKHVQI